MSATSPAGPTQATIDAVKQKARLLSIYSMMSTTAAGSGHPTSCMSAAELVAGVFFHAMKFDPKNPNSPNGDRFVLSKGHAAPLLYAALAEAGVFPVSRVMTLRAIFKRTRRPSHAANSRRRRGDRFAGPGAFRRCGARDRRAHG